MRVVSNCESWHTQESTKLCYLETEIFSASFPILSLCNEKVCSYFLKYFLLRPWLCLVLFLDAVSTRESGSTLGTHLASLVYLAGNNCSYRPKHSYHTQVKQKGSSFKNLPQDSTKLSTTLLYTHILRKLPKGDDTEALFYILWPESQIFHNWGLLMKHPHAMHWGYSQAYNIHMSNKKITIYNITAILSPSWRWIQNIIKKKNDGIFHTDQGQLDKLQRVNDTIQGRCIQWGWKSMPLDYTVFTEGA